MEAVIENNCGVSCPGIVGRVKTRMPGIGKWYPAYKAIKYTAIAALLILR